MPASKAPPAAAKRPAKKTPAADVGKAPADLIDARIAGLPRWQGDLLSRLRRVIRGAEAGITEEWKWNTPVWSCAGILCTGETYQKVVKLTFPKGASLADPAHLFNASLDGNARRAIDIPQGAPVDEAALEALIRAAVELNRASPTGQPGSASRRRAATGTARTP